MAIERERGTDVLRTVEGRRQSLLGALPARRAKEAAMEERERRGPRGGRKTAKPPVAFNGGWRVGSLRERKPAD